MCFFLASTWLRVEKGRPVQKTAFMCVKKYPLTVWGYALKSRCNPPLFHLVPPQGVMLPLQWAPGAEHPNSSKQTSGHFDQTISLKTVVVLEGLLYCTIHKPVSSAAGGTLGPLPNQVAAPSNILFFMNIWSREWSADPTDVYELPAAVKHDHQQAVKRPWDG